MLHLLLPVDDVARATATLAAPVPPATDPRHRIAPPTRAPARTHPRPTRPPEPVMRVAIAGAGNVGRSIARELLDHGHHVLLVEREPRAFKVDSVPGAQWLLADACEIASLEGAHLEQCQVVVAATGDDKVNLVVSLLAKTEFGVRRVVARINHPKNEWLFNESWGVDVSVSQPRLLAALVDEAVSVGDLVRLLTLRHGQANLLELTLPDDAPLIGTRVGAVDWPPDSALVAIVREGRVLAPSPDDPLEAGDELRWSPGPRWRTPSRCCSAPVRSVPPEPDPPSPEPPSPEPPSPEPTTPPGTAAAAAAGRGVSPSRSVTAASAARDSSAARSSRWPSDQPQGQGDPGQRRRVAHHQLYHPEGGHAAADREQVALHARLEREVDRPADRRGPVRGVEPRPVAPPRPVPSTAPR